MKHKEVKKLHQDLIILINECVKSGVKNFHLNWGLDKNLSKLSKAVEEIQKNIDKDLVEIDIKALKLAKDDNLKLEPSKQINNENILFTIGLNLLTTEEQTKRSELIKEYNIAMEGENDFEIFLLDPSKLENVELDFQFYTILKNFFPVEKED